jgi:two-component system response regulator NreC
LVEDHPIVRLGLQMLLDNERDLEIVGEADTAQEALQLVDSLQPNVVVMDLGFPDISGISASAEIKRRYTDTAVVALTIHEDQEYVMKMANLGASGFVPKRAAPDELLTAIRSTARGEPYFPNSDLQFTAD